MKISNKLNRVLRYFDVIPCDKRIHALIGVVIASITTIFTLNPIIILGVLIFIAWWIEVWQLVTKTGNYDNWDAIAVVIGGIIVYLSHALRLYIHHIY